MLLNSVILKGLDTLNFKLDFSTVSFYAQIIRVKYFDVHSGKLYYDYIHYFKLFVNLMCLHVRVSFMTFYCLHNQ